MLHCHLQKKKIKNFSLNYTSPNSIMENNATLTDPTATVIVLNMYFSTIALDVKSFIRYKKNSFLNTNNYWFIFITLTDSVDIPDVISSLDIHKAVLPPKFLSFELNIYLINWFVFSTYHFHLEYLQTF